MRLGPRHSQLRLSGRGKRSLPPSHSQPLLLRAPRPGASLLTHRHPQTAVETLGIRVAPSAPPWSGVPPAGRCAKTRVCASARNALAFGSGSTKTHTISHTQRHLHTHAYTQTHAHTHGWCCSNSQKILITQIKCILPGTCVLASREPPVYLSGSEVCIVAHLETSGNF